MNYTYNISQIINTPLTCNTPIDLMNINKVFNISLTLSLLLTLHYWFVISQQENNKLTKITRRIFLIMVILSYAITLNLYFSL